jgi:hypothetical protein
MKKTKKLCLISILVIFLLTNLFVPRSYGFEIQTIYSLQNISGFVRGPGDSYSQTEAYAVSVEIDIADLYDYDSFWGLWVYVGPYYVHVKIFVDGNLKWEGDLAAGGSSPAITVYGGTALIIIEAPFSDSGSGVYYKGVIDWIYT